MTQKAPYPNSLTVLFCLLNLVDATMTAIAVERGHGDMNPAMGWLLGRDPAIFFVVKLVVGLCIASYCYRERKVVPLAIGVGLLALVLMWNTLAIVVGV